MSIPSGELARLLVAIAVLLVVAHAAGRVFAVLRQPPVIGEILGGLLLGPSVLGLIAPDAAKGLFPASGVTPVGLGVLAELGLLMLMFLSGREVLGARTATRRRTVAAVAVSGLVIPLGAGLASTRLVDLTAFSGPHGTELTVALVFGIGVAVTSIPVISRIMLDLDLLGTRFARIVLSVALLEDVVLYVALAVILGLAQGSAGSVFGLWSLTGETGTGLTTAYYVVASLVFFAVFMPLGRPLFGLFARSRFNFLERRSPTAFRLTFLLALVLVCVFLGINPIFGAVLAGFAAAGADAAEEDSVRRAEADRAWDALKKVSMALFVPLYFAGVGLQLDLVHHLSIGFFVAYLLLACGTKSASVWLGARLAGERPRVATDLAVALNARGGPGIVLATVTRSAGVIGEDLFTVLVVLSIVTSQIAGLWLQHAGVGAAETEPSGGGNVELVRGKGPGPDAGAPAGDRVLRDGPGPAGRGGGAFVDRDHAVQFHAPPPRSGGGARGPRGGRHPDGDQHDRDLRRRHDGQ
ncbi:Kef-type K+ transport system membrane component KefB [Amycolatopsis bartoniae]|uniref:Putative Na+/H+ antiporter n=1 Tax=Amycolatopsis bartoniae TaxID=941986 RepID=A0A8H9ISJ0_9PSEU|nr:Kef-type K+ transport system membrane component KefB [Amycolatopsis bartoniae]GHF54703.1 putative Na+/H+ antiporter [Amycolatopsis bartoniae]